MNRALILMYHAIDHPRAAGERRICVSPSSFARQMHLLLDEGYRPVPLHTLLAGLQGRDVSPGKAVAITFDDGFRDVFDHALPVLRRNNIPATLFAVARQLDGVNAWMNGDGAPPRQIMGAAELRIVQDAGFEIGSHSLSHPSMVDLPLPDAAREARESKDVLEQVLGRAVRFFAYPYGKCNAAVKDVVREAGYEAACSTRSGFNASPIDLYELRRIDVFGTDSLAHFRRKLAFGANHVGIGAVLNYYAERMIERVGLRSAGDQ